MSKKTYSRDSIDFIPAGNQTLGEQIQNDRLLQSTLQAFKIKRRAEAKAKIKAAIMTKDTLFSTVMSSEEIDNLVNDFEDEISLKHPEVDHYYLKRIAHICDNVRFLKDFKDIQELMIVKKTYSLGKLL